MSAATSVPDLRRAVAACDRFEAAFRAGNRPRIEDYLTDDVRRDVVLTMLVSLDCDLRRAAGESPSPDEYLTRFPTDATTLRAAFFDADSPLAPEFVGGYELLGELGCGGMGIVYRARQPGTGRIVALKLVRTDLLSDIGELERRFDTEAKSAVLEHAHIVPVYDVGRDGGRAFIVMRLIEGRNLADELAAGPMPVRRAAEVVAKIADAVRHAHARGVLHRDLKPKNVLTDADGEPYVTDFGLACRLDATHDLTPSGAMLGTPQYMAPEQASDAAKVGPPADVYALGATLYHCLTGRPPFEADNVLELLRCLNQEEPVPPRRLRAGIDRDLETVCLRCLEKSPWLRYPSAEALVDDLRSFLGGEPIRARPPGRLERAWRWCWRHPARAFAAIAILAAIVAGSIAGVAVHLARVAGALQVAKTEAETQHALAESQRRRAEAAEARQALTTSLNECRSGEIGRGLLRLLRVLDTAPNEATDVRQAARANVAAWGRYLSVPRDVYEVPGRLFSGAFRPDGRAILLAAEERGRTRAHLLDATTGERLAPPFDFDGLVTRVTFRTDGALAVAAGPKKAARLWNPNTGQPVGMPLLHAGHVEAVAFSRDGRWLATGAADGTIRIWDGATGSATALQMRLDGPVQAVAFDAAGAVLAVGGGAAKHPPGGAVAGEVRLFDVATGRRLAAQSLPSMVTALAFSPNGRLLTAGCQSGVVRTWHSGECEGGTPDSHTTAPTHYLEENAGPDLPPGECVACLEYFPDGRTLLVGHGNLVSGHGGARLWDVATWTPASAGVMPRSSLCAAAVAPDGRRMLLCDRNSQAWLWEPAPGIRPAVVLRHPSTVEKATVADGCIVLTRCVDGLVRLWDTRSPDRPAHVLTHGAEVLAFSLSGDGRTAATGGADGAVRLWDVESGQQRGPEILHGRGDQVNAVALNHDGTHLLSAGYTLAVKTWDISGATKEGPTFQHPELVTEMAFTADGCSAVTACCDGVVRYWNLAGGRSCATCLEHAAIVRSLVLHPRGTVLTGTSEGIATAWQPEPGRRPISHATLGSVIGSGLYAGGATALSGWSTGSVQFWQTADGTPVGPSLRHGRFLHATASCGEGRGFLTASGTDVGLWPDPLTDGPATANLSRALVEACACLVLDEFGAFQPVGANGLKARIDQARNAGR